MAMLWLKQQSNTSSLCLRYLLNSPFFALLWAEILLAWQILCHLPLYMYRLVTHIRVTIGNINTPAAAHPLNQHK